MANERSRSPPVTMSDADGIIPAWCDITGTVKQHVWEIMLAAVIGIVSIKPGASPTEISRTMSSVLTEGDIELILEWAKEAGFVTKSPSNKGGETRVWWWLCLGRGEVRYDSAREEQRRKLTNFRKQEAEEEIMDRGRLVEIAGKWFGSRDEDGEDDNIGGDQGTEVKGDSGWMLLRQR